MVVSIILIALLILNIVIQRKRLRKLALQKVERVYQDKLLKTAIEVQEKERSRVARDLHDDIGSCFAPQKSIQAISKKKTHPGRN